MGRDEETGGAIDDRLADPAHGMGDDGEGVGGGFEIDEAEALDTMAVVHAGHGKDIGALVDTFEFFIGQIAEEAHGEIGRGGGGAQGVFVVRFVAGADDPILDLLAEARGQGPKCFEGDELAFARVEAADGEGDKLTAGHGDARGYDGEIGAERAGSEQDFAAGFGKVTIKEFGGIVAQDADAVGPADEAAGEGAHGGSIVELEDLGAVKGKHEMLRAEGMEKLQQHHRQHGPGLRQIDGGVAQAAALADELGGEAELAGEVVGAFDREALESKRPLAGGIGGGGLSPDFNVETQGGGGFGHLFGECRDAAPLGVKLLGD